MPLGLSFARLRPIHIAAVSAVYWIGLLSAKLGGALLAIARVALPGMHGSVNAELQNLLVLHLTVTQDGSTIWTGSASLPALFAWIAGPPLILALTARWARELETREEPAGSAAVSGGSAARALGAPPPDWQLGADRAPATPQPEHRPDRAPTRRVDAEQRPETRGGSS
jgi:hypothetical protein